MFLQTLNIDEKKSFLELAYLIANSNHEFALEEKLMLEAYSKEMEIEIDYELLSNKKNFNDLNLDIDNVQTKKIMFVEAFAMALADGIYHEEQKMIIHELKNRFQISDEYYKEVHDWLMDFNNLYSRGLELVNE